MSGFLLFGIIQFRDGPFVRPHPGMATQLPHSSITRSFSPLPSVLEAGTGDQLAVRTRHGLPLIPRLGLGSGDDEVH